MRSLGGNISIMAENKATASAGKVMLEHFQGLGVDFTEDLTTTNTGALYTTILRDAVREVPRPPNIARELLQPNRDMVGTRGSGAIKLPRNVLRRGAKLTEGNQLTYQTTGYDSITVTPEPHGAASRLTLDLLTFAGPQTILNEARFMRQAVELSIEYEFLNTALASATSDSNANSHDNQIETGGASTDPDYADFRGALSLIETYHGKCTDMICHPSTFQEEWMNDTDIKTALRYARANADGAILPRVRYIEDVRVHTTAYCPTTSTYFVDRNNLGELVEGSDLEVGDVLVADTFDQAVGAYQFVGFGIENEDMVVEVVEAA